MLVSINANAQWIWQNPLPQGNPLNSSSFINDNTGWIAGKNGTLLKTTNGGANWNIMQNGSNETYTSINFTDANNGWLLSKINPGANGLAFIKHTTNGGNSWNNQLVFGDTIQGANTIQFLNINTGYVNVFSNSGGNFIYKTTNGGMNWFASGNSINGWMRKLYFKDVNTGWVCGESGYIHKTTNGGINWSSQQTLPIDVYYGISFVDYNTGYLVGYSGSRIQKTTNGGTNWFLLNNLYGFTLWDINFINANTGIAVGNGAILRTTSGGSTWDTLKKPDYTGWNESYKNVIFSGSNTVWILGSTGDIKKSTNSGMNWSSQRLGSVSDLSDIQFLDNNTGYAAGWAFIKTTNSGTNWNILSDTGINCISFINSNTGYSGGRNNYCINKTTNGGVNWLNIHSSSGLLCKKISFTDINYGCALIASLGCYKIFTTTNGGNNWIIYKYIDSTLSLNSIFFVDNQTGWVVGNGNGISNKPSIILKTTNNGINWVSQSLSNLFKSLYSVYFINNQTGWITGDGVVLKTTNGGNNWITTASVYGVSVKFFNENMGYVSSLSGLYKSTDGGINWYYSSYNQSVQIMGAYFINQNTGWAAGYYGSILKTTNGGNVFVNNISTVTPSKYSISQNYPNPFNPITKIRFSIVSSPRVLSGDLVQLKVYDVMGREVQVLVNESLKPGTYEVSFDGSSLTSGVYFYKLITAGFTETKKMLLLK